MKKKGILVMKHRMMPVALLALSFVLVSCKKEESNPIAPQENVVRFTTAENVKTLPTYFSFDTGAVTDSVGAWDVKLTFTYMNVDPSMPAIKYPFIGLNRTRNVLAKMIDSTEFGALDGRTMAGLLADGDTTAVIGVNCLNYESGTHRLTPYANRNFVLQTGSSTRVKFKMVGYYKEAGTSGYMTIDYVKY